MDKDTVLMYQFGRAPTIPSFSPFALKLETYLRMAKINYKSDLSGKFSKKGKIPWIAVDGKEIADSSFCIEYLNKRFKVDLDKNLTAAERGASRAFNKMMEENTLWAALVQGRAVENYPWFINMLALPKIVAFGAKLVLKGKVNKNMLAHGIGRHSHEEIRSIAVSDLRACSEFLDTKQFFFGDEPSLLDAVMFGFFAQILWCMPSGSWTTKLLTDDLKNLKAYTERMKEKYWPDWQENLKKI